VTATWTRPGEVVRPSIGSGTVANNSGLTISAEIRDAIVAHARRDHPDEACGVVAGAFGSDRPTRFVPMVNAAMSPTFYEFDSGDLLRLYRDMDDRDEEPVVVYHSHTATEAYPSRTDINLASEPNAHYVLVSTRDGAHEAGPVDFRSYRISDGQVTEEEVTVVERYPDDAPVDSTDHRTDQKEHS
jgi:proteasome lid subunit RPN8/RPN11